MIKINNVHGQSCKNHNHSLKSILKKDNLKKHLTIAEIKNLTCETSTKKVTFTAIHENIVSKHYQTCNIDKEITNLLFNPNWSSTLPLSSFLTKYFCILSNRDANLGYLLNLAKNIKNLPPQLTNNIHSFEVVTKKIMTEQKTFYAKKPSQPRQFSHVQRIQTYEMIKLKLEQSLLKFFIQRFTKQPFPKEIKSTIKEFFIYCRKEISANYTIDESNQTTIPHQEKKYNFHLRFNQIKCKLGIYLHQWMINERSKPEKDSHLFCNTLMNECTLEDRINTYINHFQQNTKLDDLIVIYDEFTEFIEKREASSITPTVDNSCEIQKTTALKCRNEVHSKLDIAFTKIKIDQFIQNHIMSQMKQ